MPDYSLPRNNSQTQSAIAQLSTASQQYKLETENALLREALATSAQNCEALIRQLRESQNRFNINLSEQIVWLQNQAEKTKETLYLDMEAIKKTIQQSEKNHQAQLSKLQSMNEAFSKSLNAVLATTTDKIIAHVKSDTDTALKANREAMTAIIKSMETTAENVLSNVKKLNKNLSETFKKSKTVLDNRANAYHSSMARLFELDGWRKKIFWAGICASIATPLVLILRLIF